ncbi:MAG TPA: hypothetical protein VE982_04465 [Gaiellaceae bacterium]|nr:hypothetical protein [Gaiellaceae bacterium]
MRFVIAYCGITAALLAATASSSAGRAPAAVLRADVAEWSVVPSVGVVPAGRVRIDVRNLGATRHEIVLVRTRSFAQRLPVDGAHADVQPLAESVVVAPGARSSFVVSLKPGSYLLLDNLPWHYWKGTSAAFSVS